jgi:hypothetical protein
LSLVCACLRQYAPACGAGRKLRRATGSWAPVQVGHVVVEPDFLTRPGASLERLLAGRVLQSNHWVIDHAADLA